MIPTISQRLSFNELECFAHFSIEILYNQDNIQAFPMESMLYAPVHSGILKKFKKRLQTRYTITLNAIEAEAFYNYWNLIDTSSLIYFNNIVCRMILEIDKKHTNAKILSIDHGR